MEMTQANYNLAIARISVLLDTPSKPGSDKDIEVVALARFVEDFESQRAGQAFEPHYIESHAK